MAALDALDAQGAGVLVVAKRDRLARDVQTAALVERLCGRKGARVVSADGVANGDGPEAVLIRTLLDAFAAYERALIRARTRAALAAKKARGERARGVPIGSSVGADGWLGVSSAERVAIERARALRAHGQSLREVAVALDAIDGLIRALR